jgi:hypothetical protein
LDAFVHYNVGVYLINPSLFSECHIDSDDDGSDYDIADNGNDSDNEDDNDYDDDDSDDESVKEGIGTIKDFEKELPKLTGTKNIFVG